MTDMIKAGGVVLKTDEKGRVRTPALQREKLLDEFERSGISGPQFAAVVGVKYQTLAGWARKRRQRRDAGVTPEVKPITATGWLEAVVDGATAFTPLSLQLPGGVRVEVAEAKQAALAAVLVRALAGPC
jgi:hypothetical protein